MPRKESKAVSEGNGPVPQQEELGSFGQLTLSDLHRMMEELFEKSGRYLDSIKRHFDQQEKKLDEFMEMVDQRVASLEQDARQPRLALAEDGAADTKTCERTEGAAEAVQAMHGDSCSANRVDPDPKCSTSFGDDRTGPSVLPCLREDVLVDNGAAAPKSCLLSLLKHPRQREALRVLRRLRK